MAFNLNQFKMTNLVGVVENPGANVIQCQVLPTMATTSYFSAGQVVNFGSGVAEMQIVQAATSGTGGIGIIAFTAKKDTFYANDIVSVAMDGSIINVVAGGPIARMQTVAFGSIAYGIPNVTGAVGATGVGIALDIASAAGDIIRVMVKAGVALNIS